MSDELVSITQLVTLEKALDSVARKYLLYLTNFLKQELRDFSGLHFRLQMTVEETGHKIVLLTEKTLTNDQTLKVVFLSRGFNVGFRKGMDYHD